MVVKMDDFLLEYFRRLHFRNMPIEQFVQFCSYVKDKDYSGHMKEWAESLLEKDAAGNFIKDGAGNFVRKPLPNPEEIGGEWELSEDEWKKLFKAFRNTMRAMDANKNSFKYNDKANKFLNKYFGDTSKLFSHPTASPEAEAQIHVLGQLLQDNPEIESRLRGIITDDFSWRDLLDGISAKKYNTSPKFFSKLQGVARQISSDITYDPNFKTNLRNLPVRIDFSAILDSDKFEASAINSDKLDSFKEEYSGLMKELYKTKDIFEAFASNDHSKISAKLREAKERMGYDVAGSDDYVPPKRTDELSLPEQISDWWDTTYSECLEKYTKLRGDTLFFSPQAKNIVGAIDKATIKPTDGLTKIVSSASTIKDKIKSANARKHFDWFAKTMKELENTMPKAFAGALRNGRQLRTIVEEMILIAVRDGKVDEAKTALEVLSIVKYGYTTSKIMDTLKKTDLTIFSDKGLSFNKTDGVKFVTNALDKSIKTAFMGIGYGITALGNAINLSGSKFKGRRGRLESAQTAWQQQTLDAHQDLQQQQQADQNALTANQDTLNQMRTNALFPHGGISEANINQHRQDYVTAQQQERRLQQRYDAAVRLRDTNLPSKIQSVQQQINDLNNHRTRVNQQEVQINSRISWLQSEIANPATLPANIPTYQNELQYLQNVALPDIQQQQTETNNQITVLNNRLRRLQNLDANLLVQSHEQDLLRQQRENQRTEMRLNTWTDAKETVDFLSDRINKRTDVLNTWDKNNKDKYKELMAYWDMLETGRNTHMGKMYNWKPIKKKDAQKIFDGKKGTIFADTLDNYQYR